MFLMGKIFNDGINILLLQLQCKKKLNHEGEKKGGKV